MDAWSRCKEANVKYGLYIFPFFVTEKLAHFVIKWKPTFKQRGRVSDSFLYGGIVAGKVYKDKREIGFTDSFVVERTAVEPGKEVPEITGWVQVDGSVTENFTVGVRPTRRPPPPEARTASYYHIIAETGAGPLYLKATGFGVTNINGKLIATPRNSKDTIPTDPVFVIEQSLGTNDSEMILGGKPYWSRATAQDPYMSIMPDSGSVHVITINVSDNDPNHRFFFVPLGEDNVVRQNTPVLIRGPNDSSFLRVTSSGVAFGDRTGATSFHLIPSGS